jgi:hypothetical protein
MDTRGKTAVDRRSYGRVHAVEWNGIQLRDGDGRGYLQLLRLGVLLNRMFAGTL